MTSLELAEKKYVRMRKTRNIFYIVFGALSLILFAIWLFDLLNSSVSFQWLNKLLSVRKFHPVVGIPLAVACGAIETRYRRIKNEYKFQVDCSFKRRTDDLS